jgi:tripartite-type tricarboxylate transporter receptor subunit TctC
LVLVFALVAVSVQAQSYPQRPVRLIVPCAPGGTTDALGQEVTEPLVGEAFGRAIRAEAQRWRELAAMAGVKEE